MTGRPTFLQSLAVAGSLAALIAGTTAQADEADAKRILQNMSDYLTETATLAFNFDATLDVVTTEDQKISLTNSGSVLMSRPDRIRATRSGGFSDVEMVFDGQTFTITGKLAGLYTRIPAEGTIDHLIDTLRDTYGMPLPAADLLVSAPYDILMSDVTDVKDLGSGVISGEECDHLAFRTPDVDWQIWVSQSDTPYPCRYVITTRDVALSPQYSVVVRDWQTPEQPGDDAFAFTPPAGASGISFEEFRAAMPELPENFKTGEAQ